ncbi:tyrosine--tRNA ligase [Prosthecobacter vanneervenii]|uniref:Tyrosine--tRNA ligase n=1 Tax=Prosthecobacter vanneervenii TaxID=48466 RepID=A0A7W7YAP7_9BACT|nr:tyrosine--tRNA ligase [Prosthecobacter vanneervenii]MBB5032619.1 tyrosyl-tRNA synthetase [Prosthecobacter vanneervenii]
MPTTDLIADLEWRGLLKQCSDLDALKEALKTQQTFYCGFDPTADSLHIGNLLPLMALRRVQEHGHKAIAIVGGGTGLIGDPSGKANERTLNTPETVAEFVKRIEVQIRSILVPEQTIVENNADWICKMSAVELLRDVGKNFTIAWMLAKESVSARLESGISFTEFTYMILQAYDFVVLNERHGCTVQIGGSDQWGNMTAGIDLVRKMREQRQLPEQRTFVVTFPLITTSSGKKFGKSEAGAIWMDAKKTSPYAFYQFWVNSEDPDVPRFLRQFTLLSHEEIEAIEAEHNANPGQRSGHKRLAAEVTRMVHGEEELQKVILASQALFGGADLATADVYTLIEATASAPSTTVDLGTIPGIADLLVTLGLATSKGDAGRLMKGGGFYINNVQVPAGEVPVLGAEHFLGGKLCILRKGKKSYATVRAEV